MQTEADAGDFFRRSFPDALLLMGAAAVGEQFAANPTGSLVTMRVGAGRRGGADRAA